MSNESIAKEVNELQAVWSEVRRADVMRQVRRIIRDKGIKKYDLAARMSVHPGSVSRFLAGNENIQLDTLYRFADALDVPLTITFGDDSERLKKLEKNVARISALLEEAKTIIGDA